MVLPSEALKRGASTPTNVLTQDNINNVRYNPCFPLINTLRRTSQEASPQIMSRLILREIVGWWRGCKE